MSNESSVLVLHKGPRKTLRIFVNDDSVKHLYQNHGTYHQGDSGLDLFCPSSLVVPPHTLGYKIDLGISCEMVKSSKYKISDIGNNVNVVSNVGYYLYPRSSLSRTPLRLSNSVGIIDAGYRGTICAMVDNHSSEQYTVAAGERLFQICSSQLEPFMFELVDELSATSRGNGGFGSTGK